MRIWSPKRIAALALCKSKPREISFKRIGSLRASNCHRKNIGKLTFRGLADKGDKFKWKNPCRTAVGA